MVDLPFGTADVQKADSWFSALAESLEELLGSLGAQAVLSRALEDARRRWPQLSHVSLRPKGFELSLFFSSYRVPNGEDCSTEGIVALQGLVECLQLLLECLLGRQMAAELMAVTVDPRGESEQQEGENPFRDCA